MSAAGNAVEALHRAGGAIRRILDGNTTGVAFGFEERRVALGAERR